MPIALPSQDVSSFAVGQSGVVDLTPLFGGSSAISTLPELRGQSGVLRLHNDSGSGLLIGLAQSGQQFYVPAGGWQDCYPQPGDAQMTFTVIYKLANPPVTLLLATYYAPGEAVPAITVLGNSPIGGGVTSTVSGTTLVNTGNPPATPNIIQIQPSDAASPTWSADNSGNLTINSDNAGTLTTLLHLIAGASPAVKLAAASVLTEVLGNLQVDGSLTVSGHINNAVIDVSAGLQLGATSAGDCLDQTSTSLFLKALNGGVQFQSPNGTTRWTLSRMNGNGNATCGSATVISHGLGVTPDMVLITARIAQPGSATTGSCSWGSTSFTATVGSGSAVSWLAMKF